MNSTTIPASEPYADPAPIGTGFRGNDRLLLGIIMGVLTFWLFAQTTLNIAPDMQKDLGLGTSLMNIAVAVTALFSGIFIVFIGGLADRIGRVRIVMIGFVLSIIGVVVDWLRARRRACGLFPAARPCAPRPIRSLHHAGEPCVGQVLLGR